MFIPRENETPLSYIEKNNLFGIGLITTQGNLQKIITKSTETS